MLPAGARLRRQSEFSGVLRGGARASSPSAVVHVVVSGEPCGPRAGLVVGKSVGRAVERNLVKRRLRHIVRDRLDRLPDGARVVVRALPGAAAHPFAELSRDIDRALPDALRKAAARAAR